MPRKVNSFWKNDRVRLIIFGFILAFTALPIYIFAIGKLSNIFPRLGFDFFSLISGYLLLYNWYSFKDVKKEKGKYFIYALIYFIFIQIFIIFSLAFFIYFFKIKRPKYGGVWFGSTILFFMCMTSYVLYDKGFRIIKKAIRKRDKAKGVVQTNKFQEIAKVKIEQMLKEVGAKNEEFRKVLKENEILLQSDVEIKDSLFMVEISEDSITLAAEKEEDAFILELINFKNQNELIEEFCKRAKGIFEKAK